MTQDKIAKKPLAVLLVAAFLTAPVPGALSLAGAQEYSDRAYQEPYERPYDGRFSRQQLENLLAPVALYPDPLLAQILVAASFVDQIEDAARFVRRYTDPYAIDDQPWDVSVKAVAHYPSVLHMMAERIDWTIALGQAYVEQPEDVMASVQFLRWRAHRHGNLVSDAHHEVIVEREYVEIVPVRPDVIYVPVYEPEVIFFRPAPLVVFGPALPIGVWLIHDFDWHRRRVYYHGWGHHHHWRGHRHWVDRSRPHVRITNVYVNNRFNTVRVNRDVVRRNVNVTNLNRFATVNRDVRFENVERRNRLRGRDGGPGDFRTGRRDADDRRGDNFRGRPGVAPRSGREDRTELRREDRSQRGADNRSLLTDRNGDGRPDRLQGAGDAREEARERLRQAREARERARGARQENPSDNRSFRSREDRALEGRLDRGRDTREQNRDEARERLRQAREDRAQQRSRENAAESTDNRSLRTRERSAPRPPEAPQTRPRPREFTQENRPFRGREIAPPLRADRERQARESREQPAVARPPRGAFREDRTVEQNKARGERRDAREKGNGTANRERRPAREI